MVAAAPIVNQSALQMMSNALVLCGEKPLTSTTDPRYGTLVMTGGLFDMVYENELTANPWRFACKKGTLTQLNSTPLNEWQYAYQLPTDCLSVNGLWGVGPDKLYDIYAGVIYTNITSNPGVLPATLTLDYMFKPDPGTVPSYFSLLVTLALTQYAVKPITENDTARTAWTQAYNIQRARAMFSDARQRPNRPLQHKPFLQVR